MARYAMAQKAVVLAATVTLASASAMSGFGLPEVALSVETFEGVAAWIWAVEGNPDFPREIHDTGFLTMSRVCQQSDCSHSFEFVGANGQADCEKDSDGDFTGTMIVSWVNRVQDADCNIENSVDIGGDLEPPPPVACTGNASGTGENHDGTVTVEGSGGGPGSCTALDLE